MCRAGLRAEVFFVGAVKNGGVQVLELDCYCSVRFLIVRSSFLNLSSTVLVIQLPSFHFPFLFEGFLLTTALILA